MLQKAIPVTVFTGFLGSGKTTLLSALLRQKEMENTAVIINEFGEIGLDHALVERSDDNIIELRSGCICCTIKGHLENTLLDLYRKRRKSEIPPFDRVVIETTGLADPAPIINMLMVSYELTRFYALDGVVTLVDAVNGEHTLDTHIEAVKQAAMADRILLSKTDLADEGMQNTLTERLQSLNPSSPIIPIQNGEINASKLFGADTYSLDNKSSDVKEWLAIEKFDGSHDHDHSHDHHEHGHNEHHDHHEHHDDHHHHDVNRHSDDIHAFSMTIDQPVNQAAFSLFLRVLAANSDSDMLRVKGIVNLAGEEKPVVIHGVQHVFHPPTHLKAWPDDDKRTKLVFITRNLSKAQVENFYNVLV